MKGSFTIHSDLYPISFFVSIGQLESEYEPQFKRRFKDLTIDHGDLDDTCEALTRMFTSSNVCLIIFKSEEPAVAHVAHELFHATYYAIDRIGMRLCGKSQEAYAYMIGWLTNEFYKKYKV